MSWATYVKLQLTLLLVTGTAAVVLSQSVVTKYVTKSGTCSNGATNYNPATNTCGSGSATVYTSIRSGIDNVGAGNILLIRSGTYSEICAVALIESGTSSVPTIIAAYPGEIATWIKDTAGDARDCLISFSTRSWISIRGNRNPAYASTYGTLIMDGNNDTGATDQYIITTADNATDLEITGIEIRNGNESCITTAAARLRVTWNEIHHCGLSGEYLWHGLYFRGDSSVVQHNDWHDIYGWAIHCYSSSFNCDNVTITLNHIYVTALATIPNSGGIIVDGANDLVERNTVQCTSTSNDYGISTYGGSTNVIIRHNSVFGCNLGVYLQSGSSGVKVQNNNLYGNTTPISNSSTGSTIGTNLTSNPSYKSTASYDLTLLAGSAAIDACPNIGLTYNGSAPDCGAFETFTGTGGTVSGNTLDAQLGMAFNTPIQPGTTGWSVNNGRSVTGVSRVGSSIVRLTFSGAACTVGQSWTWSYSGGTATDSVAIGTVNQPLLAVSSASVTNSCSGGGGSTYEFTQAAFRYHALHRVSEATPEIRSGENDGLYYVVRNGATMIRFAVTCGVADCPQSSFALGVDQGSGYSPVLNVPGGGQVSFCADRYSGPGILPDPTPSTCQLSIGGTCVPGGVMYTAEAVPPVTLAVGQKTELEYCVAFTPSASGTYPFRLTLQDGTTPLAHYTQTPVVTMMDQQGSGD
ncbi:MAG: hypothetical protein JSR31_05900 [Nitrospira sp.]|nr:hypothetical protein [Nitrospira sp.]